MPLPNKTILLGLGGVTTLAGAGYGVHYALQDKTISDKLIREGTKLISNLDEYEIAFLEGKHKSELRTAIGNIDENSAASVGGVKLKAWCEKNLKLELTEENIKKQLPKVKEYCSKPSTNIEEIYKKLEKALVADDEWATKYEALKRKLPADDTLNRELNIERLTGDSDNSQAGQALQTWCNKKIKTKLTVDKDEAIWKKVKERCLQD